jgi:hypothetical protein
MKIQADLSVCTSVCKNPNLLKSLLSSLYQTAGFISLEVIVVDKTGLVADLLGKEFPRLILFEDVHETNSVRAVNRGLELATGRHVSIWDNDVCVKPACLQNMLDFLDGNPDVGIAGPRITNAYGRTEPSVRNFPTIFSLLGGLLPLHHLFTGSSRNDSGHSAPGSRRNREVEWLQSGAHIIRREVFEEIGFFDSSLPWDFAEMDYYLRARKAGWHSFFCPGAQISHPNPARYHQELRPPKPFSEAARDSFRFLQKKWLAKKTPFQDAGF